MLKPNYFFLIAQFSKNKIYIERLSDGEWGVMFRDKINK